MIQTLKTWIKRLKAARSAEPELKVTISGPGIVSVKSSELIKTKKVQEQLNALKTNPRL